MFKEILFLSLFLVLINYASGTIGNNVSINEEELIKSLMSNKKSWLNKKINVLIYKL